MSRAAVRKTNIRGRSRRSFTVEVSCWRHLEYTECCHPSQRRMHRVSSKSRDAREVKIPQYHRRHQHLARFRSDRFSGFSEGFYLFKDAQRALVKTEISHSRYNLPVFDEKRPVPRHARQRQVRLVDRSDVPKIGDEDGPIALLDQLLRFKSGRARSGEAGSIQSRDAFDSLL